MDTPDSCNRNNIDPAEDDVNKDPDYMPDKNFG